MAKALKKNNLYPNIIFSSVLDRSINTSKIIIDNLKQNITIYQFLKVF